MTHLYLSWTLRECDSPGEFWSSDDLPKLTRISIAFHCCFQTSSPFFGVPCWNFSRGLSGGLSNKNYCFKACGQSYILFPGLVWTFESLAWLLIPRSLRFQTYECLIPQWVDGHNQLSCSWIVWCFLVVVYVVFILPIDSIAHTIGYTFPIVIMIVTTFELLDISRNIIFEPSAPCGVHFVKMYSSYMGIS